MLHLKQILSHLPPDEKNKLKKNEHEIQGMHVITTKGETNKQAQKKPTNKQKSKYCTCRPSCSTPPAPPCSSPPGGLRSQVPPCDMDLFVCCLSIFVCLFVAFQCLSCGLRCQVPPCDNVKMSDKGLALP